MKTIVIVGASSGVGKEVAKMLKGENLILLSRNEARLKKVANSVGADYYVCDVTEPHLLENTFNLISQKCNGVDALINCAGIWNKGEISKQDQEQFAKINTYEKIKQVIDTNTFGAIAVIKAVFPLMKKKGGQIININSQSGVVMEEFCPVYNASKHGSRAFSQAVISDLAKNNIRMTDICPGLIKTEFYDNCNDPLPKEIMDTGLDVKDVAKLVKYVLDLPKDITIPSVEIKHIKNY